MEERIVPAIVLGSHVMGLAVIRALGIMGVPIVVLVYDEREDMGYVSKYVTERIPAPHPEKSEDQFIELLVKCAARLGGSLLIPTSDETLGCDLTPQDPSGASLPCGLYRMEHHRAVHRQEAYLCPGRRNWRAGTQDNDSTLCGGCGKV